MSKHGGRSYDHSVQRIRVFERQLILHNFNVYIYERYPRKSLFELSSYVLKISRYLLVYFSRHTNCPPQKVDDGKESVAFQRERD